MKFLIIPVRGALAENYAKIYDALNLAGDQDYATYFRRAVNWAEATPDNPYLEVNRKCFGGEKNEN